MKGGPYDTDKMIKEVLEIIKREDLCVQSDIFGFTSFSQATFYNHKLENLEVIKKALIENRIKKKVKMKRVWEKAKAPVLQLAAFKLIANEDELSRLKQTETKEIIVREPYKIVNGDKLNPDDE